MFQCLSVGSGTVKRCGGVSSEVSMVKCEVWSFDIYWNANTAFPLPHPQRLRCLNAWPIGSGIIRRCGLVGGNVSLWGWVLRSSVLKVCCCGIQSPSVACRSRCRILSSSPAPCLPAQCDALHHDDNGLNLWTVSQPQLNVFLYKSCLGHGVSSQQWNLN